MGKRICVILLMTLGSCAATSVVRPPGRDYDKYANCLSGVYGEDEGSPSATETRALTRLARDVASGRAFTNDQSDLNVWSASTAAPAAQTPTDLRNVEHTPFQKFLDCYVGDVDPIDYETRLLRGHMALAMIAVYAEASVAEAPAAKKKQYAQTAIGLISAAELGLRSASWAQYQYASAHARFVADKTQGSFSPPPASSPMPTYSDNPMRLVTNVARVDKILSTAAFADSVVLRNIYGLVLTFVGEAASKVSPVTIAQEAASQALNAFSAAIRSNAYEGARYAAAAVSLRGLRVGADTKSTADDEVNALIQANWPQRFTYWKTWDEVISTACTGLSAAEGTAPAATCLPTDDQITLQSPWARAG